MSRIASAIIGEAGSLLSSGLQALTGIYNTKKQVQYSKELMDYNNNINIANWQRQNAYNAPSAEMSRLRAAGINPDMYYSQGASGISASPIASSSGSVGLQSPISTDFGKSTMQSMLMDSQKKLLDSQTAKNLADANQTNQLTPWVTEQVKSQLGLNEANTKLLNENVEKVRNESELLRWQSSISQSESEILKAVKESRISQAISEAKVSQAQADVIEKQFAQYYSAQLQLAIAQSYASYVNADANRMNASTNRMQYSLDENIKFKEIQLKTYGYKLQKALNDAHIKGINLNTQWQSDLNESGVFGRVIGNLLSIPGAWLGSVFR